MHWRKIELAEVERYAAAFDFTIRDMVLSDAVTALCNQYEWSELEEKHEELVYGP